MVQLAMLLESELATFSESGGVMEVNINRRFPYRKVRGSVVGQVETATSTLGQSGGSLPRGSGMAAVAGVGGASMVMRRSGSHGWQYVRSGGVSEAGCASKAKRSGRSECGCMAS
ncbi:hypothetical protein JCM33374_g6680 [Metschnikowia sp. JCM 33374]|nr:hypothetical protein JCM33374_g6680 [Metschnikowia sp. JCM 33374]